VSFVGPNGPGRVGYREIRLEGPMKLKCIIKKEALESKKEARIKIQAGC
jgi:hypothetical protein